MLPLVLHQELAVRPIADVAAIPELRRRRGGLDDVAAERCSPRRQSVAGRRQCRARRTAARRPAVPDLPCRQHKVTMLLPLERGMWERLDRKVRNQIRKAQKSDLTVERGGVELLAEFYAVFARNMRDLGTPVYSPRLFEEVLARSFRTGPPARRSAGRAAGGRRTDLPHRQHAWNAVGVVGARLQRALPESSAVLEHASSGAASEGCDAVRLRPLDAGRRHLQVQGAVGRRAGAAALGIRSCPKAPRCPRLPPAIQSSD